jgi:hypothetical protein
MDSVPHHDIGPASDRSATLYGSNQVSWVMPDVLRRGIQALYQPTGTSQDVHLAELRATNERQAAELQALKAAHTDPWADYERQVTAHQETRRILEDAVMGAHTDARDAWLEAARIQHALDGEARAHHVLRASSMRQSKELSEKTRGLSSDLDAQIRLNAELQAEQGSLAADLQQARTQISTMTQACTDAEVQWSFFQRRYSAVVHDLEVYKQQALTATADANAARSARDIMLTEEARARADRDALIMNLAKSQEDLALAHTALSEQTRISHAEIKNLQETLRTLRSATHAESQLALEHRAADRTTLAERTLALESELSAVQEELRHQKASHEGMLHLMSIERDAALAAASRAACADLASALDNRNDSVMALITVGRFARGARMALVDLAVECKLARNAAMRRRVTVRDLGKKLKHKEEECNLARNAAMRRRVMVRDLEKKLKHKEDLVLLLEDTMSGIQHLTQPGAPSGVMSSRLACIAQLANVDHAQNDFLFS